MLTMKEFIKCDILPDTVVSNLKPRRRTFADMVDPILYSMKADEDLMKEIEKQKYNKYLQIVF